MIVVSLHCVCNAALALCCFVLFSTVIASIRSWYSAHRFLYNVESLLSIRLMISMRFCFQDKFRMCGAKAFRHIFLFNKAVLVAKRKADGILIVKAFIMVFINNNIPTNNHLILFIYLTR